MRATIALAALAAAAAACGGSAEGVPEGGGGGEGGGGMPAMPVEVAEARADTVIETIGTTGAVEAVQSIMVRPEVDGRIVRIHVREGASVGAGTPLFKIDDAELVAQVARAEADWDLARQALERTRTLLDQNASSQADLERAEATERSSRVSLELLRIRLERTTVRAPFAGLVGARRVSLGDYVTTSTELISLQTADPMRASFEVPERFADVIAEGQAVNFRVAALPGEEFEGIVEFVDPVVQLPGRTITTKARVPNRRRQLQPGMFIEVRLAVDVRPNAVVIPEEAVVSTQAGTAVWVVADGKVERREVDLGVRVPGEVEVRRGVQAGESVVVGGQAMLQPGAPVMARPKGQPMQAPGGDQAAPAVADSAG